LPRSAPSSTGSQILAVLRTPNSSSRTRTSRWTARRPPQIQRVRFAKQCGAREFALFTRWLDRYVDNWAHTDGLSLWLLGASIANDPSLVDKLDSWTRSNNRWKRRAAAVALVYSAKRGEHTRAILRIAAPLIEDGDDMVQKGVGWLLKETYPKNPAEVVRFSWRIARRPRAWFCATPPRR
jgi:3-methyladenine DNA glycosylase AlkD